MSTLYQDRLIKMTDDAMVFHGYYFPSGGDKRVPWNQIERIQVKPPSLFGGSWRLWGTGDLRTWYPQDYQRPSRDRIFRVILRDRFRQIGFTVEDSAKVMSLLRDRGVLQEIPSA
jgi:hypothetical protein